MGITLLILIGLLQSYVVVGQGCKGFRFYDGDDEVTNFTCILFTSASCRNGPSTFPNNLSDGSSVGKPRNLDVRVFQRNLTVSSSKVLLPSGVEYTWEPPLESISREYLKGFYLKQIRVGSGRVLCRLIDLQNVDLTASTRFHFSFEIYPFQGKDFETHLAYLTSLPPPTDLEYEGLVQQTVFTIQPTIDYSSTPVVYPSQWTTWINVKLHGLKGIVEARFSYPAPGSLANFTSFELQLVPYQASNSLYNVIITKTGSETEGRHNFTNVPTGTYRVQVQPLDPYPHDEGKCLCWDNYNNQGNSCQICKVSAMQYFNFTDLSPPRTTTTPASDSSTPILDEPGYSEIHAGVVVVAVVVPVLLLSVAAGVLVILYRKGILSKFCKGGKDLSQNNNNNNKDIFIPIDTVTQDKDLKAPQLTRKKVLLLASEDHEFFTGAVEKLASFLEVHCMCDVTFAPQQMSQLRKVSNSYCWLSRQIDSADFVIIITSEAAYWLYQAFQEGNGYMKAAWGPEGDLFTPGIRHICGKIANSDDLRNIIRVYFDHTPPSTFRLPIAPLSQFHYHLPNHLSAFLHHIHGLDKGRMDLSQVNLPLQGNVKELEGGQEWLDAVQQAEKYERLNPKWFELKFGKPAELYPSSQTKPDYTKQDSDDSGYTEARNSKELKRRLSSASNTAEGMTEEVDLGVDNGSYIKDYFSPPSMITANTAYTIPFPDGDKRWEIDDTSITEAMHKLNQQYEEEQQHQKHSLPEENSASAGPSYEPQAYPVDGYFVSIGREEEDHDCISVSSAQSV